MLPLGMIILQLRDHSEILTGRGGFKSLWQDLTQTQRWVHTVHFGQHPEIKCMCFNRYTKHCKQYMLNNVHLYILFFWWKGAGGTEL